MFIGWAKVKGGGGGQLIELYINCNTKQCINQVAVL